MTDYELDWTREETVPLGVVVGGSLSQGLDVRMLAGGAVEETKVGTFVTVEGGLLRFFGIITDLRLESADHRLAASVTGADAALASVASGISAYAMARVSPMLTTAVEDAPPQPARSLPAHFAPVNRASDRDVQAIFGSEDAHHFYVGTPLDMKDVRVCLNLEELVKRSNGVFGKSGTGKSFLTRILLAGIAQKELATHLVFDMHSEYGWQATSESGYNVKGLKQLFSSRVAVISLDAANSLRRGLTPDYVAEIGYAEIEPEDVAVLAPTLNITELGVQASFTLARRFGDGWMTHFLALNPADVQVLAQEVNENVNTLNALHQRLRRLERFDFLSDHPVKGKGAVATIMDYLDRGLHVVLEFGRYGDELAAYLLVANILTRRIHSAYRDRTERAFAENAAPPKPLVITIEEAHRFLNSQLADQTIFGTIAREMRKYSVTLLVVDQRPSGIDDEVLSQIGTRITCQLDNERDVDAVLSGAHGARELRGVLSRLESQQQALIFGHALPMPVVVRTRDYDTGLYSELGAPDAGQGADARRRQDRRDLFGKE
jgi:DNA helicase HerA-like ATPase